MKTKIIITGTVIISACTSIFLNAQSNQTNLDKYWHYRYRLVNYFMVVGDGQGESLPADVRNLWGNGLLNWGETPRYLGWYIGVLATEYRLLANNGQWQALEQTKKELYYALKALERLDNIAETLYCYGPPSNCVTYSPSLNGFLTQDDIYSNFVQDHYIELNKDLPVITYPPSQQWLVGSGFPAIVDGTIAPAQPGAHPISQDMCEELMIGLSLVKKCVDPGPLSFPDKNSNMISDDLRQRAIDEADRIISYVRENTDYNGHKIHWQMLDPSGGQTGNSSGGDFRGYAQGWAHTGNFINEAKDYSAGSSDLFLGSIWQQLQGGPPALSQRCPQAWNIHIILGLASISDSWHDPILIWKNQTKEGIQFNGYYDEYTLGVPCPWAENHYGWDLFYGALHRYLHNCKLPLN